MRYSWKRSIGILAVVGGLVVATAGMASAQAGDTPGSPEASSARGHHVRRGAVKLAFETAVATIGIESSTLKEAVRSGQTIGQVADANGVPAASVVDAIVAALEGKVDEALAAGRIDEAGATRAKERIPAAADRFVNTLPRRLQSTP